MAQERGGKPVDVLTFFQNGKIDPIKFRWNGKVYPVTRINKQWTETQGVRQLYHFIVESIGPDNYELSFDSNKFTWQIVQVA